MEIKGEKGKVAKYRINMGTGKIVKLKTNGEMTVDFNDKTAEQVMELFERICQLTGAKTMEVGIKAIKKAERKVIQCN
jgi:hypothetical protein